MAKLKSKDQTIEVADGSDIKKAAEELGVSFGCYSGMCATCQIKIESGMSNLNKPSQAEKEMELNPGVRLACQCKIKKGTVKIKF